MLDSDGSYSDSIDRLIDVFALFRFYMPRDVIFGLSGFGNEIVWQRTNAKGLASTRFARNHDILLRYSKGSQWIWNSQYTEHDPEYLGLVAGYRIAMQVETSRRF